MTAAIICPGPSAAHLAPADLARYDLTIAVNRAIIPFKATVWATVDYPVIRDYAEHAAYGPILLSRRQTARDARSHMRNITGIELVEDIQGVPNDLNWQVKTMTCAMAFVYGQGYASVDIYGCDWSGTKDFDGAEAGEDRSDERWTNERCDAERLMAWMGERNCKVTRCVAP